MSETNSNLKILDLFDILQLTENNTLGDFLKQEPVIEPVSEPESKVIQLPVIVEGDETDENTIPETLPAPKLKPTTLPDPQTYSDASEYVCHNPTCQYHDHRDLLDSVTVYEITADETINICCMCFCQGYRFCLITHEVHHLDDLDPVLESVLETNHDQFYIQKQLNQNQLHPDILSTLDDFDEYFQMVGIENPCPHKTIIDLKDSEIHVIPSVSDYAEEND